MFKRSVKNAAVLLPWSCAYTLTMLNTGGMQVGTAARSGAAVRKDAAYVAPRQRYPQARDECGRNMSSQKVRDDIEQRRY